MSEEGLRMIKWLCYFNEKISSEFAYFFNHHYGNVNDDGTIKQYMFVEGDLVSDVVSFLEKYYPGYAEVYKVRKGTN